MMHIPHRKASLTPSILFNFRAHFNLHDSAHLALLCTLLVGFFTFLRTANLIPHAFDRFSPQLAFSRGSVHFNDSGACLTVTRTKTRQVGDTALARSSSPHSWIVALPEHRSPVIKLKVVPAPDTYPLFTYPSTSNQLTCITAKSLNDGIKHLASLISLDPQDFSGHSLRLAGASFAVSQRSFLSFKETGALTLKCCIYHCL